MNKRTFASFYYFQRVREKNMRENKAEKKKSKYVLSTEHKDHEKPNPLFRKA